MKLRVKPKDYACEKKLNPQKTTESVVYLLIQIDRKIRRIKNILQVHVMRTYHGSGH